jgi:hypothetical protein
VRELRLVTDNAGTAMNSRIKNGAQEKRNHSHSIKFTFLKRVLLWVVARRCQDLRLYKLDEE